MFYRDIILTVAANDERFFRGALISRLHEAHHKLGCAIAFPHWQDGQENAVDTYTGFTHYASPGSIVRLFSSTQASLEALPAVLELAEVERKGILRVGPVRPVPQGCRGVAYCRSRSQEGFVRKSRQSKEDLVTRQQREAKLRKELHKQAYITLESNTGGQRFPLYIARKEAEQPSADLKVTSYGLSNTTDPCFLPDF